MVSRKKMAPLVSIGVPLLEGVDGLSRSIDTLLAQTYANLEIILVDDTSVPDIEAACRQQAARDPRIGYVSTPGQFGVLPSHAEALARSSGTYFMWLGVGDQLSADFIALCVERMEQRSDLALAVGRSRVGDQQAAMVNVYAGDPIRRVENLLDAEIGLDLWYGLFRRSVISAVSFRNAIGFELALLAEVAFAGKIESVEGAWCERYQAAAASSSADGDTRDPADSLGVPAFQAEDPYLVLAVQLFCNIAFLSNVFATLPQIDRIRLAVRVYTQVVTRWPIIDESRFISFAVRVFPESRITEKLHELRLYLAKALSSDGESKLLFEPLSRAEEIINGLGRMKIGRLPATQAEREMVKQFRMRFEKSRSQGFKNRALLALTMFV